MKSVWKWILIVLGIAVVVFLIAMAFMGRVMVHGTPGIRLGLARPYIQMGRMMAFGWGFMILRGLLGLAVLGFAIYGIVALASHKKAPAVPPPAPKTCGNCGRVVEKDWVSCPYCGHSLKEETTPEEPKATE